MIAPRLVAPGPRAPGSAVPFAPVACLPTPTPVTLSSRLPAPRGADFVVVDIETTGWLDDAARITEIGAVRLSRGRVVAEFCALVNPGAPIPPEISALTGITDAMVADALPISHVLPRFLDFAGGCLLAAHNAPFDIGFLTAACRESGIAWPPFPVIDTAVLARLILDPADVPDHKLATLSEHFSTRTGPCHRALADAKATAGVLTKLLRLLATAPAVPPGGADVLAGRPPPGEPPAGELAPGMQAPGGSSRAAS